MSTTMDWKKETTNRVFPTGTYHVRIISHERVKASTGTPQVRWKAEILSPEEYKSKTILEHTPLTESSLWRIATFIASCGVDVTKLPPMDVDSPIFEKVLKNCHGRSVYWYVVDEIGKNGLPRNTVKEYKQDDALPTIQAKCEDELPWA